MTNLPTIDEMAAVERVTRLMAIPGKSGEEGKVVAFITEQLVKAGIPKDALTTDSANKKSPRGGETGNLILKLPGTFKGPRRLLMAHVDTVPLCVGAEPVRMGDLIASKSPKTALGGDDRAGASVVLTAILEIQRQNLPHPPLTVLWCVQEEIGLYGARFVGTSKLGNPKLCFNWDGSAPEAIAIGATGDYAIEIEVHGIASHAGAHPEDGVSAISIASVAIADLHANGWLGKIEKGKESGTANIGVYAGGDATNVVTPLVQIKAEARSHDPAFRKKIVAEIEQAFTRAVQQVKTAAGLTGRIEFTSDLKYEAFKLKTSEPVVQSAIAAVKAVGLEPNPAIVNGGLDANWMANHGFPTVTLGCGQQAIHTVEETLHVPSYLRACQIGLVLATGTV